MERIELDDVSRFSNCNLGAKLCHVDWFSEASQLKLWLIFRLILSFCNVECFSFHHDIVVIQLLAIKYGADRYDSNCQVLVWFLILLEELCSLSNFLEMIEDFPL